MIKKIVLISLIATSGFTRLSSMHRPENGDTVNLTVKDYLVTSDADDTLITEETSSQVQLANQYNVQVRNDNNFGGMFVNGYYKANAKKGSTNKVVVRGSNTNVENYYSIEGEHLVFVIDTNNKLIGHKALVDGSSIDSTTIDTWTSNLTAPTGYNFDSNLYYDNSTFVPGVTEVRDNMILRTKLTYDETYAEYQVAVFGDTASVNSIDGDNLSDTEVDVKFDKKVKVTSTAENFSYWKIGNRIVSYNKEYTFSVYSDVVIEEVVGEVDVEPQPVINLYHNEDNDDMTSLFICGYELPAGYTMVETGMLFGGESYETAAHRVMANRITDNNEFAVKYVELDKDISSAYLVYKDTSDNVSVVYDNGYGYEQLYFADLTGSDSSPVTVDKLEQVRTVANSGVNLSLSGSIYYDDSGFRIGSSSKDGEFTITLPEGKLADEVYLSAKEWDYDEQTLKVNGVETQKLTDSYSLVTVEIADSNTITISKGEGRGIVNYVGFKYNDSDLSPEDKIANSVFDKIEIGDNNTLIEGETLPSSVDGTDVTWDWEGIALTEIDNSFIPDTDDDSLTVTATIDINGVSKTKDYVVTLISRANTLANIKAWVIEQDTLTNLDQITEDIVLPTTYSDTGIALSWEIDNPAISDLGVVTRGETDSTGELWLTVTIAGTEEFDYFNTTVLAEAPTPVGDEQVIKTVGFESSEGFSSSTAYDNTSEKSYGPNDFTWKVMEGTVSTTSPITGNTSMQCRDYTGNGVKPYIYTDFALTNATKVTFNAKNSSGINMIVQYSLDGGNSWTGDEKFTLSTSASEFTYILPQTVESCQFKFSVDPDSTGTNKAKMYLDDVNFYGLV